MSPRSKIIVAAVLFSTGGAAIKWCGFGAWQLAACRATLAMLTILVLLPEARRGCHAALEIRHAICAADHDLPVQDHDDAGARHRPRVGREQRIDEARVVSGHARSAGARAGRA